VHSARAQISSASAPLDAGQDIEILGRQPRFQKLDVGGDVVDARNVRRQRSSPYR